MRTVFFATAILLCASTIYFTSDVRPAFAACSIECTETDDDGKCTKLEKVCTGTTPDPRTPGGGTHVSPPARIAMSASKTIPMAPAKKPARSRARGRSH